MNPCVQTLNDQIGRMAFLMIGANAFG